MTSEASKIYLPGDADPTVCGVFQHAASDANQGVGSFSYGKSYLGNSDAVAIDPKALPLNPREYRTTGLRGVFGALNDAMPDDWGRYVIDRTQGEQDFPIGYMLRTVDDAIGNLAFSASPSVPPPHCTPIGIELLADAREIILGLEKGRACMAPGCTSTP